MSLLNGSQDENGDPAQQSTNGLGRNGKSPQKVVITNIESRGNGLNNNQDAYKMDMKTNGNDKIAEEDPLTGHRRWHENDIKEGFQPRWAQRFASTNFFMVIFLLAYVLQGCYFTYFVSVITTIEKLFKIKSASIALLLNFSEIGQICTSLFLTYFAGRGHRPRWIACGMFLFSIAAFGSVSPHFLFGSKLYKTPISNEIGAAKSTMLMSNTSLPTDIAWNNMCLSQDSFNLLGELNPGKKKYYLSFLFFLV